MKTKLSSLPDTPKQIIKYGSVGVLNVVIYLGINYILINYIDFFKNHLISASIIAGIISFSNGLYFNRKWTFKSEKHWMRDFFYIILFFAICTFVQNSVYAFFLLNLNDICSSFYDLSEKQVLYISQAIGVITFATLNFSLNKFITFRK